MLKRRPHLALALIAFTPLFMAVECEVVRGESDPSEPSGGTGGAGNRQLLIRGHEQIIVGSTSTFRITDDCVTSNPYKPSSLCTDKWVSDATARFEPAGVFEFVGAEHPRSGDEETMMVTVRALQTGRATATFTAKLNGEARSKSLTIDSVVADGITGRFCQDDAPYLATAEPQPMAFFPTYDGEQRSSTGLSLEDAARLLSWEPENAFEFVEDPAQIGTDYRLAAGDFRGEGEFMSSYDPEWRYPFRIVDPTEVDFIELDNGRGETRAVNLEDEDRLFSIHPKFFVGDEELCGLRPPMLWRTLTPEVCQLFPPFGTPADEVEVGGPVNVRPYQFAPCTIEGQLVSDEQSMVITQTYEIVDATQ